MPVITKEMLGGTKHLKHLNISYNILSDIREGKSLKRPMATEFYANEMHRICNFRCVEQLNVTGSFVNVRQFAGRQDFLRRRPFFRLLAKFDSVGVGQQQVHQIARRSFDRAQKAENVERGAQQIGQILS